MRGPSQTSVSRGHILVGDAQELLSTLPTAFVDCVTTSPPYFRLRDYGVEGQLGLEPSVRDWVDNLAAVGSELARVLVPTGTLWLNLGDSFSTHTREGAARKSLLLGPEQLAVRLSRHGWILRNKIIWAKPSTTPTSVRDRLSTTYELIYVLTRQPRYYFDLDAIRVPHTSRPPPRRDPPPSHHRRGAFGNRPRWLGPNADSDNGLTRMHASGVLGHPLGKNPGDVWRDPVTRYRGAHFATYPLSLVKRMIRAGCPELRCSTCRMPWHRPLRRSERTARRGPLTAQCLCRSSPEPGLILDPFIGAGTTALAAERLQRDWLGIELNRDFAALAETRLAAARTEPSTTLKTERR